MDGLYCVELNLFSLFFKLSAHFMMDLKEWGDANSTERKNTVSGTCTEISLLLFCMEITVPLFRKSAEGDALRAFF